MIFSDVWCHSGFLFQKLHDVMQLQIHLFLWESPFTLKVSSTHWIFILFINLCAIARYKCFALNMQEIFGEVHILADFYVLPETVCWISWCSRKSYEFVSVNAACAYAGALSSSFFWIWIEGIFESITSEKSKEFFQLHK